MINYGSQYIDNKDIQSVTKVLKSNWLTQGPQVEKFEKVLKNYFGANYCAVVNSGTAALHLACLAIGCKENDIIITTPISFLASANATIYTGASPLFVDIDSKNYCIDLKKLEKKLLELKKRKRKVKAVIATDFAGQTCDWKRMKQLSKKFGFFTINDNCHAFGSKYYNDRRYAAKYADIVTHSYHPVKAITTGEGGSLFTNNKFFFKKAVLLRTHGIYRSSLLKNRFGNWYYEMRELGYNYRLSDIACALGVSQIKKIKKFLAKRKYIANFYNRNFKKNNNIITPYIEKYCSHSYHLYLLKINFKRLKLNKKKFFNDLLKKNINLQVHYIPIHLQKYYKKKFGFTLGNFPVAEKFYQEVVSLPIFYSLKKKQMNKVIKLINFYTKK